MGSGAQWQSNPTPQGFGGGKPPSVPSKAPTDQHGKALLPRGGFPFAALLPCGSRAMGDYLSGILDTILYKDIVARKGFRDAAMLKRLALFIHDNIGSPLSVRDEATLRRELAPLESIRDHYPKTLLTLDPDPPFDYNGIRQIPVIDFLLAPHSLETL